MKVGNEISEKEQALRSERGTVSTPTRTTNLYGPQSIKVESSLSTKKEAPSGELALRLVHHLGVVPHEHVSIRPFVRVDAHLLHQVRDDLVSIEIRSSLDRSIAETFPCSHPAQEEDVAAIQFRYVDDFMIRFDINIESDIRSVFEDFEIVNFEDIDLPDALLHLLEQLWAVVLHKSVSLD